MILRRLLLAPALCLLAACSTPDASAVVAPTLPTEQGFPYVAEVMVHRCGTLDCHGSLYRNLRVFGDEGLRFASADRPCVPAGTTSDEVAQDYTSTVELEPETLSAVLADRGANPERLALIAKPVGLETHKGGTVFHTGDDTYVCLTSWLEGVTNTTACLAALPATVCAIPAVSSVDASVDAGPTGSSTDAGAD